MSLLLIKNGVTYDLEAEGIETLRFFYESLNPQNETDNIENEDGSEDLGTTYGPRILTAYCKFAAADYYDYSLKRSEVYRLLTSKEPYYLIHYSEPWKRWKVKLNKSFLPEKKKNHGIFTLEFIAHNPYAESAGTTLDPFTFDSELWGMGQGLTEEDAVYAHSTSGFTIFNAGDVAINPRRRPLKITFTGASTNLTITNNTTGETWSYTGTTTAGQTLTLDGVRSLKNGASVFGDTNRKLITLQPGPNDFTVTGATGTFTITFDFRFYYV
ncbi:phage tail family protein [Fictibacillus aquaticus]|uniref:Phage tail protein n=1 Tax=Fictibacillus aquaticus TaxID=2021314 RepID=A0A235FAB1_9BACL|nr:phage tail family protein [Fictibacillus aquaticus]OYD57867.1 phage tail protein [Fictibacillus aquaticus]